MLESEFVRSLQCNYERVHLGEKPDESRYQYCILTRGGIKGLLACSLRYINGEAYLYYDITSRQNVAQLFGKQTIDRKWVTDFFWSLHQVRYELARFLLDEKNILLYPEQIFQDLGNRKFLFLYLPYSEEENGMKRLLEFMLEHMDYDDDKLVESIYSMYERLETSGETYLQEQIFEDAMRLEQSSDPEESADIYANEADAALQLSGEMDAEPDPAGSALLAEVPEAPAERKSIWQFLGSRRKKAQAEKKHYRENMRQLMEGVAVAEEPDYDEEDYGRTIYVEQPAEETSVHKLYTPDGRVSAVLEAESLTIGKQKGEAELVLDDASVSRIHARIYKEGSTVYLEDLNSTNGTFKNGLRMQPYEKRRLEEDDEIRFGKVLFVYR